MSDMIYNNPLNGDAEYGLAVYTLTTPGYQTSQRSA